MRIRVPNFLDAALGAMPRGPGRVLVVLLGVTSLWAAATTWYLVFHDEVLARFISQQSAMQYGYEERIATLRMNLDRAAIERATLRDTVEGRLATLVERQTALERRQGLLSTLARDGATMPAELPARDDAIAPESRRPSPMAKPFPTPDALELRMRDDDAAEANERHSARQLDRTMAQLDARLDRLSGAQARGLDGIAAKAGRNAQAMRTLIARLGLDVSRFERSPAAGLGGPLVPIATDSFGIALAQAQRSVGEEDRLRRVTAALPLRQPLSGVFSASSSFGPRLDPFTRGLAMHTGIDMKAETGEPARATAAGHVAAAEYAGGYGNMVEIDHGNGLSTRYAHLSVLSVVAGQSVAAGAVVGRVGSTGRSTGSHLHYETRIDGEPVDPQRFLRASAGLDVWPMPVR